MPFIQKRRISVKKNKPEHNKIHNDKWSKYYRDKRYRKLRDWYMSTHLICEECAFNGISRPAEHLHHRIPISTGKTMEERFALLLDWENNFEAVCAECHRKIHNQLQDDRDRTT